ncbi:response regulator transcription factor [Tenacibaculum sp. M341]|uniref:response regulator transcription factor n=1 Tax=Tenacibaculum sp. M341 TaxID=2530339 RepID=UPI001048EAED|nr:response regulator transcription factor [Tenacibaculum sp. M341]TCI84782.1 response regulator transcription factor [Tenacibaculum sp. M341]
MDKINIVLVDDHLLFLNGLKASLTIYSFVEVVATFTNPKEALTFIKKSTNVDLIITDISMPDVNGIEFIKQVKKLNLSLKTLVISMFQPLHYEHKFYDGYLLKDTDISIVIEAIKSIVYNETSYFYDDISDASTFAFSKNIVTKREREIIILITEEHTVEEIAAKLFLSRHTVETHKKNIFLKLQVKTNAGLVKKAIQLGYI